MQTASIRRYKNLKIRLDLQRKNTRIVWGFKEFRIPVAGALTKWYNYTQLLAVFILRFLHLFPQQNHFLKPDLFELLIMSCERVHGFSEWVWIASLSGTRYLIYLVVCLYFTWGTSKKPVLFCLEEKIVVDRLEESNDHYTGCNIHSSEYAFQPRKRHCLSIINVISRTCK